MKLFLFALIAAPIADFFVDDGRYIDIALSWLASAAHTMANLGASMMPSMN